MRVNFSAYGGMDKIRHQIPTLSAKEYATVVNEYYTAGNLDAPYTQEEINSFSKGTNWLDEISQTGMKQNYSLSISGGTAKNAYATSISLYKGQGVIKNTDFTRGNIKLSNDMKILPNLKYGVSLNVNYGVSNNTD